MEGLLVIPRWHLSTNGWFLKLQAITIMPVGTVGAWVRIDVRLPVVRWD